MRIDATHRPWMAATAGIFGLLGVAYIAYAATAPQGPGGGTWPGIAYGVAGYGLMLYAALLGVRKRFPIWRVGRGQTWMRGHLWLGLLSLPVILFHCAFVWKGTMATVLMVLLFVTVGSGILGAALQHYLPSFMTRSVPLETIYEEIPHVRRQLCEEADLLAATISGSAESDDTLQTEVDPDKRARFGTIYAEAIRPVLVAEPAGLREPDTANLDSVFDSLRKMLPAGVHTIVADLENICEEERQLQRQRRIYAWLHGWLLVHVPLSVALLVLGAVHAVMALRY